MIYNISLAVGFEKSGVDTAMASRAAFFEKAGLESCFIFGKLPNLRELKLYRECGMNPARMLTVPLSFTDCSDITPKLAPRSVCMKMPEGLFCDEIEETEEYIALKKEHSTVAAIDFDGYGCVHSVVYFQQMKIFRRDFYSDHCYASEFYNIEHNHLITIKREYYNTDGSVALEQILQDDETRYMLPNGQSFREAELCNEFIRRLKTSENDIFILDRPHYFFSQDEIMKLGQKCRIIAVLHSDHFFKKGLSTFGVGTNREYMYWFKYSNCLSDMIVSTVEQKRLLEEYLKRRGYAVPKISAIPVCGIPKLKLCNGPRTKKNILCASRLNPRKKVEWSIAAVIKSHETDREISLDIYGSGDSTYVERLKKIVSDHQAESYIHFMGHCDLAEVYQKYSIFLTTSIWETLGITLMEACAAGLAIVGLDVQYGNHCFIRDGKNGFMVPYDPAYIEQESPKELVDNLSNALLKLTSDEKLLDKFGKCSYEIAEQYLEDKVQNEWLGLLKNG